MLKQYPLFDSHLHIIDPQFPLVANNGYLPPDFSCEDYLQRMKSYQLCGGAVVSGSFQAFDQSYLTDALAKLGDNYVGITQLSASVSDDEILRLNKLGVRAVRFNLYRGGSEGLAELPSMAARIYEIAGWHVELYMDSNTLPEIKNKLVTLPKLSIDHLGLSEQGLRDLCELAATGVKIKACGFSRLNFSPVKALKPLYSANPDCLMFGSDLPSTRAPSPYSDDDFKLVLDTLGDNGAEKVFSKNAIDFYKSQNNI